jgi:hypothetical protein
MVKVIRNKECKESKEMVCLPLASNFLSIYDLRKNTSNFLSIYDPRKNTSNFLSVYDPRKDTSDAVYKWFNCDDNPIRAIEVSVNGEIIDKHISCNKCFKLTRVSLGSSDDSEITCNACFFQG